MSDGVSESEQLATALRMVAANWPRPSDRLSGLAMVLGLRPSARSLIRRFRDGGPVVDAALELPEVRQDLVDLTAELARHLTSYGFVTEARTHLLAALAWSATLDDHRRWRVISALAWAEGLGGDPDDRTLEQRRQRARNRLLPLLALVPDDDSLRPTILSRAARFTNGEDTASGDRTEQARADLHRAAYELASQPGRAPAVFASATIRYAGFLRDSPEGRPEARRITLDAADRLAQSAPDSRPYLLMLNQAASIARTTSITPADWDHARTLRRASIELARTWTEESERLALDGADGFHRTLAAHLDHEATLLVNTGDLSGARAAIDESIELTRTSEQHQPGNLATRLANRADLLFAAGQFDATQRDLLEAIHLGDSIGSTRTASRWAGVVFGALLDGDASSASEAIEAMLRSEPTSKRFNRHRVLAAQGLWAAATGSASDGIALLDDAIATRSRLRPAQHPDVLRLYALRAIVLASDGSADAAAQERSKLSEAVERQFPDQSHWILALAQRRLPGVA